MSYASDALIDALKRENNKLKADNERLRQDIEDQESYDQMLRDRLRQLTELHVESNAENAKLRELVRELLPCYQWSDCYDGCMAADGPLCPNPAKLTERARELGVEVEG